MRLAATVLAAIALVSALPSVALAQAGRRNDDQRQQEEEAAKKRERDKEWNQPQASLPAMRNAGPCPYVKVLYDAGRYVELTGEEAASAVGFTGEIQNIGASCAYKDADPIQVTMQILFSFGKGPQAQGDAKTYRYWVAVTARNQSVLAKEYFDIPVQFDGKDRVMMTDTIADLVIPRAGIETSGSNFEVLVGFDVTPQMAEFNRDGKRFRLNAGQAQAAAAATTTTP